MCRNGSTSSAASTFPGVRILKNRTAPPFPYSDVRLLPYLQHSFWFLPNVASCHAMAKSIGREAQHLLARLHGGRRRRRFGGYRARRASARAQGHRRRFRDQNITLSCGKLTTVVTVPQWSAILMLRNLKSPETYFQAAFRVQSPWSIRNPNGRRSEPRVDPQAGLLLFDFAPTRALRQLS
jgi:hypothetical protein